MHLVMEMDKEQDKGRNPLDLATGREKFKYGSKESEDLRNEQLLDKMKILFTARINV